MTATQEISQVLDHMPYGLYIVGTRMESECNGMMADWAMQTSFSPPLLVVAFENDAQTLKNIRLNGAFTLNFLSTGDPGMRLAQRFAQPYRGSKIGGERAKGVHHKLEDIDYSLSSKGCPILRDAMAWLECESNEFVPVGDHTLVISEVVDGHITRPEEPLSSTFTGWKYSG
jgi:flavin reductase (DIM6/NTAB) family NADH-FMN oxidoreductase RutF